MPSPHDRRRPSPGAAARDDNAPPDIAPRNISPAAQSVVIGTGVLVMIVFVYLVFPWMRGWLTGGSDPCVTLWRLRMVLMPLALLPLVGVIVSVRDALNIRRHDRTPWPGQWRWRDTAIRRGAPARRRAWLLFAAAALLLAGTLAMGWLVLHGELASPDVHARCDGATAEWPP